jgi:putative Mg2+ transporter-C (MgtC) family protein
MDFGPSGVILLRLLLAAGLGGVVGLERELRRKPAGLRTSMFICLGSALFTFLSGEIARRFGDPSGTRIVSNLIPGIGFLGAGAILRERGSVTGLTTAATIFVLAGVGMAVGAGVITIAVVTTAVTLFVLIPLGWLEDRLSLKQRLLTFRLTTPDVQEAMSRLQPVLEEMKILMQHFQALPVNGSSVLEFEAEVSHAQQMRLTSRLMGFGWKYEVFPARPHE